MLKTKNKHRASILGVTLIVLGMILTIALSISLVSIKDRKASIGEGNSGKAFQNAQSGVEVLLDKIANGGYSTVNELSVGDLVCDSTGVIKDSSGLYDIELKKADGTSVSCSSSTALSDIASIKSVGTSSNAKRAIEAAVAATSAFDSCVVELDSTSGQQLTHTCADGAYAVSGSCWRDGATLFIGDQLEPSGKAYTCRWEGGSGLKMTVMCCK